MSSNIRSKTGASTLTSERTAVNHVHHILTRLGLHSRAQVAAWAVEHGLPAEYSSQAATPGGGT